jgi:hypothetical protein
MTREEAQRAVSEMQQALLARGGDLKRFLNRLADSAIEIKYWRR